MVIAIPEIKANLTCVYKRYNATPICKGKLEMNKEMRMVIENLCTLGKKYSN